MVRFVHPLVKLVAFSPNEKYFVTWSPEPIAILENAPAGVNKFTEDDEGNQIAVWDVKTGALLRTFPPAPMPPAPKVVAEDEAAAAAAAEKRKQMPWPALKWSGDDKYVARITPGSQISVYELPSMGLVGKKSIKIDGVIDFEWCPIGDRDREAEEKEASKKGPKKERENMFAYWTPEVSNQPARVTLMAFPSRVVLRSKNLFNVSDVSPPDEICAYFFKRFWFVSVRYIGKMQVTSSALRLTGIPRQKSQSSAISKYFGFGKRITPLKSLSSKVRTNPGRRV